MKQQVRYYSMYWKLYAYFYVWEKNAMSKRILPHTIGVYNVIQVVFTFFFVLFYIILLSFKKSVSTYPFIIPRKLWKSSYLNVIVAYKGSKPYKTLDFSRFPETTVVLFQCWKKHFFKPLFAVLLPVFGHPTVGVACRMQHLCDTTLPSSAWHKTNIQHMSKLKWSPKHRNVIPVCLFVCFPKSVITRKPDISDRRFYIIRKNLIEH